MEPDYPKYSKPYVRKTPAKKKFWQLPSRKWFMAQAVALAGLATSAIDSGWDDTESKLAILIAVQALATYLFPNGDEDDA